MINVTRRYIATQSWLGGACTTQRLIMVALGTPTKTPPAPLLSKWKVIWGPTDRIITMTGTMLIMGGGGASGTLTYLQGDHGRPATGCLRQPTLR
jgi:hypothetical protein